MAGASEKRLQVKELRCDNCGAPWERRSFLHTRTHACENCGAIFEGHEDQWTLIQKVEGAYETRPAYALGTRGNLDGVDWEVVGWTERSVTAWGVRYAWEEHLLFNPYEGFRYLMLSDGHFAVVSALPGVPATSLNEASYNGRKYKHFSSAEAVVDEVLGEFPWQVKRGDVATASDFVDPPYIISCEESSGEANWSGGRYLERDEVVAAFGQPSRPVSHPRGIHPAQANPHAAVSGWMKKALAVGLMVWLVLSAIYFVTRSSQVVYTGVVDLNGASGELKIPGEPMLGPNTLEIDVRAPGLHNNWVWIDCLIVDPKSEKASYAGVGCEYYAGPGWSEGSSSGSTLISGVPKGDYVIQLTPARTQKWKKPVKVTIRRDVRLMRYPCCTFFFVFLIPAIALIRDRNFEKMRWAESDHPMT
ncbi:MAG: DUF4178 domain-containing protein [Planctomycetes bacterium]|nr:DUF4178 domain-containing protein [Planctomycetota bacterium]